MANSCFFSVRGGTLEQPTFLTGSVSCCRADHHYEDAQFKEGAKHETVEEEHAASMMPSKRMDGFRIATFQKHSRLWPFREVKQMMLIEAHP